MEMLAEFLLLSWDGNTIKKEKEKEPPPQTPGRGMEEGHP